MAGTGTVSSVPLRSRPSSFPSSFLQHIRWGEEMRPIQAAVIVLWLFEGPAFSQLRLRPFLDLPGGNE